MKYVDIHCHLDFPDYDKDRENVLARMRENEIGAITIGADLESSKRAVEIAEKNENIWATIGIHPEASPLTPPQRGGGVKESTDLSSFPSPEQGESGVGLLEGLVKNPKVVAIGECGLDYFRIKSEEEKINQKKLFESQIQFALKHNKPLMIHCRDAYDDTLEILKNYPKTRGNIHFFAGDTEIAKKFLDLGFTLSFTGVITFPPPRRAGTNDPARNASLSSASVAGGYDEVIKYIPQNSIMSETDAPFVAPVPYRGKRNEPAFVIEVIKKLAEIRGENVEDLNHAIISNFKKMFLK